MFRLRYQSFSRLSECYELALPAYPTRGERAVHSPQFWPNILAEVKIPYVTRSHLPYGLSFPNDYSHCCACMSVERLMTAHAVPTGYGLELNNSRLCLMMSVFE